MQESTTITNGTPTNPVLAKGMMVKKNHQPNGVYQTESSLRWRLFTFSAGDKISLKTQMTDMGENGYLPLA